MEIRDGVLHNVTSEDIHFGIFVIPKSVTQIGKSTFQNCKKLKKIKFHDKIDSIGSYAFEGCTSLMEVNIPDSVRNIEAGVFSNCTSLVSVRLPKGLQTIKAYTFECCTNLKDVGQLDEALKIEYKAFYECSSLETIAIPKCEELGDGAFEGCTLLKSLLLSKNFRCLYAGALMGCNNLDLDIETSLFYCKNKFAVFNFCHKLTINGFNFEFGFFKGNLMNIQAAELKSKINDYLFQRGIYGQNCYNLLEHYQFIEKICNNLNNNDFPYDYREDFKTYMNNYIKGLYEKGTSEYIIGQENDEISNLELTGKPEIITFDNEERSNSLNSKVEKTLSVNVVSNEAQSDNIPINQNAKVIGQDSIDVNIENETIKRFEQSSSLEEYNYNDIYAYAKKLGLTSWVTKLKQMISMRLLGGNVPKKCFSDISHDAFIREILQCISDNKDYDYKSDVDNYMKNYIETHQIKNENINTLNSLDNSEDESLKDKGTITENDMLKQRIAELEQELLFLKNQDKVLLNKESIVEEPNNKRTK